jgi:hypothetical protein
MSVEKIQEFIGRLCPSFLAVPEDMLVAFIELVHYCMRHPDLLVGTPQLKEQLGVKAAQFAGLRHDDMRFIPAAIIERTVIASQVFLYFLNNVV